MLEASARLRLTYRRYRRSFATALRTHHGLWQYREGLLVRLSHGDRQGYGEIAPLPWFGSETVADAQLLCQSLPATLTREDIHQIPARYPTCRFGLESAWEDCWGDADPHLEPGPRDIAHLLPTGAPALASWARPWQQGYRTFKWKIGTAPLDQELKTFEQLVTALPTAATLRLDANGGLTLSEAEAWLAQCDRLPEGRIDCLEQPLPVGQFPEMLLLQQRHRTTLGLDESVASVAQLERCLMNGWQGVVVIKAAIAGFPSHLRQVCQRHGADIIWSSVFETAVARRYAFHHLIPAQPSRALGYGTGHWFTDGWDSLAPDQLWSRL